MYRYSLYSLEHWKVVDLKRKRQSRPAQMGRIHLSSLYSGPRKINPKKLKDLLELLRFIPLICHDFYESLNAADTEVSESETHSESEASESEQSDSEDGES